MATGPPDTPSTMRSSDVSRETQPEALPPVAHISGPGTDAMESLSPETERELRNLSIALQKSRCQARRMENFACEPVSLPVSRASSPAPAVQTGSMYSAHHHSLAARSSPSMSAMHSPPLTPAGTTSHDGKPMATAEQRVDTAMMVPQTPPPYDTPPKSMDSIHSLKERPQSHGVSRSPSSNISPSTSTGNRTPGHDSPNTSTPIHSRPLTQQGEKHDPYSRDMRPPQPASLDSLEARFVFGGHGRRKNNSSPTASVTNLLSRSRGSGSDKEDKRTSFFGGALKPDRHGSADDSEVRPAIGKQHVSSMSELKRFFKFGGHKHKDKHKRAKSPTPSTKEASKHRKSTQMIQSLTPSASSVPFADDHGLQSKYGKFGRVLGAGAGGSVRLLKRSSDGVTFAVKQFRARHPHESERDYNKKVTAEFCIGSTLHHGNIVETMDLANEKGSYFVVMEYAPFDLFAIVMTGKMSREEMTCCTLQILNGVKYLHSMGLAHRDLKLDNVVVSEHGIMKMIDFGSAAVFQYPFENDIVLASGIVGSDPYLAPEVYDSAKYDPQPTDIWSLAIIFCCMSLRRFPWKLPRISDHSYKLFVTHSHDGSKSMTQPLKSPAELNAEATGNDARNAGLQSDAASRQTIMGPWRLLRLLPRESRHIIGRMLEIEPRKRATLDEILEDKWVKNSQVCSHEEGGRVMRADNHEHTLEPSSGSASAPASQQKK